MKLNKIKLDLTVDMVTNEVKEAIFQEVVNGEYLFSDFPQNLQLALALMQAMKDNASVNPFVRSYGEHNAIFYDDNMICMIVELFFSDEMGIKVFLDKHSSLIVCK